MRRWRRRYYDVFSTFYDRVIALHSRDAGGSLRAFLLDRAGAGPGRRLLDLCTGTGAVALRAAERVDDEGLVVGIDFSEGMIRRAREKARTPGGAGPFFVVGDVAGLPFRDAAFDAVTCSHAMYELDPGTREAALAESVRVLRPGGRFVMMEHCEPARPLIRALYRIRLAAMGSAGNRAFARNEVPFLARHFRDVTRELAPGGRSKVIVATRPGAQRRRRDPSEYRRTRST